MAQEFFLKTVNNVPADESGNVELTIGVSLLRQEFNFTNSQSFTLNSNYSQVYAIVVQGVTLSNSQFSLNGTNGFTILDTLNQDDFIVVIYALNIGGVTPSYTKAEVDALINAELNIPTAGNVLRANGTEFLSISEVEFMRNLAIYQKAPDSKFFDNKQIIAWDSFDRADENPIIQSDSGHNYSTWRGIGIGRVVNKRYSGNNTAGFGESAALITFSPTKNIGIEFSFERTTNSNINTGIFIIKNDSNYFYFGRSINPNGSVFPELPQSTDYRLVVVINNVATVLASIVLTSIYGGGNNDGFANSRLNFLIKYGNRGRESASRITVQSLDTPAQRFDIDVAAYNSTFETPSDYNKLAITANRVISINSYKIANLDL